MADDLFKNKYRIKSARREGYDYAQDGFYFVTICTYGREIFFGNVIDGKMVLNKLGRLADKYWLEIPSHFKNVILDEYIVMPNHVHGIIVINNNMSDKIAPRRDEACLVSTDVLNAPNAPPSISQRMQKISPKSQSLPVIIGSYKSTITRESKTIIRDFAWQTRFYDHIIRNE